MIRYHRNKKGEEDTIHDQDKMWDTASDDSFLQVGDSIIEPSRAFKSYGDESTKVPSNSMFTHNFDRDPSKYIDVEIDKSSFMPTNGKMLDLKKLKTDNYNLLKDEQVLNEKIRKGKLIADQEAAETNFKSVEKAKMQTRHIYA